MKNVPIYCVRTLIIARIAATIIPTPIDFNNLIIIMRVLKSRICSSIAYVCLRVLFYVHKEKQKVINKSKQYRFLTYHSPKNQETKKAENLIFAFFVS